MAQRFEPTKINPYSVLWHNNFDPELYNLIEIDYENGRGLFQNRERPERLPEWKPLREMRIFL